MKKGNITGIEITDNHVKLFQARPARNHYVPYAFDIRPLNDTTDAGIKAALAESVKGRDIGEESVMMVIPRRSVILKQLMFPSDNEHEIRKMIGLQLSSQIPYSRDEVVYDFSIVQKNKDGYTSAVVVFINKTLIHRYLKIFNSLKIYPYSVFVSSFGIVNWYKSFLQRSRDEKTDGTTVIIDVDYAQAEVCFCSDGKCVFSRNIKQGSSSFAGGDVGSFVDQLGLTFGAFKKEDMGPDVGKIVVIETQPNEVLARKLEEYYKVPVVSLNPFDTLTKTRYFQAHRLEKFKGISFTSTLGFFEDDPDRQINFMPKEVLMTKRSRQVRFELIKVIVLLLLTGALATGVSGIENFYKYQYLNQLKQQLAASEKKVRTAEKDIKSLNFVRERVQYSRFFVDVLEGLFRIVPEDITFRVVSYELGGNFEMQGTASNVNSVNLFQSSLLESNLFKEVNLQFATQRKRFSQEYTDFKIICKLDFSEP